MTLYGKSLCVYLNSMLVATKPACNTPLPLRMEWAQTRSCSSCKGRERLTFSGTYPCTRSCCCAPIDTSRRTSHRRKYLQINSSALSSVQRTRGFFRCFQNSTTSSPVVVGLLPLISLSGIIVLLSWPVVLSSKLTPPTLLTLQPAVSSSG